MPLRACGPPCSVARGRMACGCGLGAQIALQDVGELFDEGLLVRGHAVDVTGKAVVGDHSGDGGKQADGGGHQGFGNARRHGGQRDLLHARKAGERVHDAPHGAKQATETPSNSSITSCTTQLACSTRVMMDMSWEFMVRVVPAGCSEFLRGAWWQHQPIRCGWCLRSATKGLVRSSALVSGARAALLSTMRGPRPAGRR